MSIIKIKNFKKILDKYYWLCNIGFNIQVCWKPEDMASDVKKDAIIENYFKKHMIMCCMDMHYLPDRGSPPM